jgi:hypothetical protein
MTFYISHHEPGVRLGVDRCPGIGERGHGLTMSIIHDYSCCAEWESGQASTPTKAREFREAAIRWGAIWPGPEPEAGS